MKLNLHGGFVNCKSSDITVKSSSFQSGVAIAGGAISWSPINQGLAIISDSTFEDNWAISYSEIETLGGAIFVDSSISSGFRFSVSSS